MDLHQLRTLLTVAQKGSITQAAKQLHLSQPAVSAHIKSLEQTLGLRLFERTTRGMQLTYDGERIVAKARSILHAQQALFEEATRLKECLTGQLRIGVGANSTSQPLNELVRGYTMYYPEVELQLLEGDSKRVVQGLYQSDLDLGFLNATSHSTPSLRVHPVAQFRMCIVAPRHTSKQPQPFDWRQLLDEVWIVPSTESCCGKVIESLLHQSPHRPQQIIRVEREHRVRSLVTAGLGIGILHTDTAQKACSFGELSILHTFPETVYTVLAYETNRTNDPMIRAARSILQLSCIDKVKEHSPYLK